MKSDVLQVPSAQKMQPEDRKNTSNLRQPLPSSKTPTGQVVNSKVKKSLLQKLPGLFRTKRGKILIIVIMVSLVVGAAGLYYYATSKGKERKDGGAKTELTHETVSKPNFGYMAHHVEWQQLEDYRERWSYLSWERAQPGYANWQEIEPKKGQYNWERIDQYVTTAQENNIQILLTIYPFTDWDQETCNSHIEPHPNDGGKDWGKYGKGKDFLRLAHRKGRPCDMEAYQEFLRRLVERYDGDDLEDMAGLLYPVTYWEIGNEPGIAYDFFQGTTQDYFEILKTSYITIKETDSNAVIVLAAMPNPGIEGYYVTPEFDTVDLFELGAANYFDIANSHGLGGHKIMREFLSKYGAADKPIWVTEAGGIREQFQELLGKEDELALALTKHFIAESKYGATMFFVGGGEDLDPAIHKAINIITQEFKDSIICENITGDEKSTECYIYFAEETQDKSLCEEITDNKQKDECFFQVTEKTASDKPVQTKTANDCKRITDSSERDVCYLDLVQETDNSDLCEEITDEGLKDKCYLEFARQTESGSSGACEKVTDVSQKDMCYVDAAIKSKNASLCDEITGSEIRKVCYAVTTNDIGLCDEIADAAIKDQCNKLCEEWNK